MIQIKVYGMPAPQGSKRHVGHGVMIESSKAVGPWRDAIRTETQRHDGRFSEGPVLVRILFYLPRPKGHYGTGRNASVLKAWAPERPVTYKRNDIDKLARAVLDGITDGGALRDDGQVASLQVDKFYADETFPPGCLVTISAL